MEQRPKVGVGVIVMRDGKILLQQRMNAHGEGTWSFPGGHLEFNEELEECVRREVEEETGLAVKDIKFAGLTNDKFEKESKHYITIFMLCEHESGEAEIKEPEKCIGMDWFDWDKMPSPLFLPIENLLKQGYDPFKN
jgi:8-oxo-dGTP diphosphatase